MIKARLIDKEQCLSIVEGNLEDVIAELEELNVAVVEYCYKQGKSKDEIIDIASKVHIFSLSRVLDLFEEGDSKNA